jgi:hypothetical protein
LDNLKGARERQKWRDRNRETEMERQRKTEKRRETEATRGGGGVPTHEVSLPLSLSLGPNATPQSIRVFL